MFRTEPSSSREELGFIESVRSAFQFLTTDYGFQCVEIDPTLVRYESPRVFVNVYHGRGSYEIGCEIGLIRHRNEFGLSRPEEEERFSIWEIGRLVGAPEVDEKTFIQASTRKRVRQLVPRVADLVRKYAPPALNGDARFFERLREARTRWFQSYMKEMELERTRKETARAWQRRDYEAVVRILESMRSDLTPAELKKLDYARKQLGL